MALDPSTLPDEDDIYSHPLHSSHAGNTNTEHISSHDYAQEDLDPTDPDVDLSLSDAQSISLSTPPRSPTTTSHSPSKSGRPSSTLIRETGEDGIPVPVSASREFFREEGELSPGLRRESQWASFSASDGYGRREEEGEEEGERGEEEEDDEVGALRTATTITSATSMSRLLEGNETTPITPSSSSNVLGPAVELHTQQQQLQQTPPPSSYPPPTNQQQTPKTPLSARLSQILSGSPSPQIATMPVPRPRPASLPLTYTKGELILGVVVIDFNHLVGPKVEFTVPPMLGADEEMCGILPFLALPDGAHLSSEDYCYFHLSSSHISPDGQPQTVFGISCNRQIQASQLTKKSADVTRSTVQKAVVVLASKPIFGPIRDKLGVVTRAYFNQLNFDETQILVDFYQSLEGSLSGQLTESALYMGTSLRELVHKFRHKTLILLKMLLLQKKIMFFGQPVETLCTYQYSLVSLIPGLLDHLSDCASPLHDRRENDFERPSELRTSDRLSLLRYLGLPLNVFGKDSFFQPYLPLQEVDMLKQASGYLCGTTNNIVTQQRDARPDLLVNIESMSFEFSDARTERTVGLTSADRKWMEEIVRSVQETWVEGDPGRPVGMQFLGSDDYLRAKFEDYICSALSGIKYADFLSKGAKNDVLISGAPSPNDVIARFGEAFIRDFKQTRCGKLWDRTTDPVLFDICEPRHPCDNPPSLVSDIGVRLTEGLHELNLEERIAPAREVLNTAWTSGLKAAEGLQANIAAGIQRLNAPDQAGNSTPQQSAQQQPQSQQQTPRPTTGLRQLSLVRESFGPALQQGASVASEGAKGVAGVVGGWGSFLAGRVGAFTQGQASPTTPTAPAPAPATPRAAKSPPNSLRAFSLWERKSADGSATSGASNPSLLSASAGTASSSTRTSTDTQRESRPSSGELEGEKPAAASRGSSWSWLSRTSSSSGASVGGDKSGEAGMGDGMPEGQQGARAV